MHIYMHINYQITRILVYIYIFYIVQIGNHLLEIFLIKNIKKKTFLNAVPYLRRIVVDL